MGDEVKLHSERAMAELDLALRAPHYNAAQAHLALSALHLERMRRLSGEQVASQVSPERHATA